MRVAIFGGSGFVGSYIYAGLSKNKKFIINKLNIAGYRGINQASRDDFVKLINSISIDINNYDVVINCIGVPYSADRNKLIASNTTMPVLLYQASIIANVPLFIHISSANVNEFLSSDLSSFIDLKDKDIYTATKAMGELNLSLAKSNDCILHIIRPSTIYGRGSKNLTSKLEVISKFIWFLPKSLTSIRRNYLYVGNLVSYIEWFLSNKMLQKKSVISLLNDDHSYSIDDLCCFVNEKSKSKFRYEGTILSKLLVGFTNINSSKADPYLVSEIMDLEILNAKKIGWIQKYETSEEVKRLFN